VTRNRWPKVLNDIEAFSGKAGAGCQLTPC
jgi:hypothetical protein